MKPSTLIIISISTALLLMSMPVRCERTIVVDKPQLTYFGVATVLNFDIEYEEVVEQPGPYYLYSERYLGTKADIEEHKHYFRLTKITPTLSSVADTAHRYTLSEAFLKNNKVTFDNHKCLVALNASEISMPTCNWSLPTYSAAELQPIASAMPLNEEQLLAGSTGKMAEGVAKMIYRLRENRLNLLLCEVDNMPQDSRALELLLSRVEEEEKRLTALFLGTRTTVTHKCRLTFIPQQAQDNIVLFRFSTREGLVDSDNLIGEPYFLDIRGDEVRATDKTGAKYSPPTEDVIHYCEPAQCKIKILDLNNNTLLSFDCPIAQFGTRLPLPSQLIKQKSQVIFNGYTGEIKDITNPAK